VKMVEEKQEFSRKQLEGITMVTLLARSVRYSVPQWSSTSVPKSVGHNRKSPRCHSSIYPPRAMVQ